MPQVKCEGPDCPLCKAGSPSKRNMTVFDRNTLRPLGHVSLSDAQIEQLKSPELEPGVDWVLRRDNSGFFLEKA